MSSLRCSVLHWGTTTLQAVYLCSRRLDRANVLLLQLIVICCYNPSLLPMNSWKGASVTPLIVKSQELSHASSWTNNLIVYVYTFEGYFNQHSIIYSYSLSLIHYCLVQSHFIINCAVIDTRSKLHGSSQIWTWNKSKKTA